MRKSTISRLLAICTAVALSTLAGTPALANPTDSSDETTTTTVSPTPATSSAFGAQFESLTAAMLNFYASSSGSSISGLLQQGSPQVASVLGGTTMLPALSNASSLEDLQQRLKLSGLTLDLSSVTSTSDLFAEVNAKAATLDGRMTLFGANYATALGAMRVPALAMPGLDQSSLSTALPTEGLAFGLFMNASVTNLVANHPDVFAQVRNSGLGTPQALEAWKTSMLQAGTAVGSNLSRLPLPCIGEMLQGMATGVSSGSSSACGSCAVAGAYLHNHASTLLDPNANTAIPQPGTSDPSQTQPWLQDALNAQNPGLSTQLEQVLGPTGSITACSSSSEAASSALSSMLPGLFSGLRPSEPASQPTSTLPGGFGTIAPGSNPLPAPSLPSGFDLLQPR